jgi:hypothetical protein
VPAGCPAHPVWLDALPVWLDTLPVWLDTLPVWLDTLPVWLDTLPVWLDALPVGRVFPVRLVQPAVRSGRVTSVLRVSGMPPVLAVSRVPAGFCVQAASLRPAMLPVTPARFIRPVGTVGLRCRLGEHVLAGRPGYRLLLGQRRIEPGHKVAPCRILVALSALGVIPVRHVSTAAYRSLPSTIAALGPVPGG